MLSIVWLVTACCVSKPTFCFCCVYLVKPLIFGVGVYLTRPLIFCVVSYKVNVVKIINNFFGGGGGGGGRGGALRINFTSDLFSFTK